MAVQCPCGKDHTDSRAWHNLVFFCGLYGELVDVPAEDGTVWLVPRVWLAMHGLRTPDLPDLAAKYGWKRKGEP